MVEEQGNTEQGGEGVQAEGSPAAPQQQPQKPQQEAQTQGQPKQGQAKRPSKEELDRMFDEALQCQQHGNPQRAVKLYSTLLKHRPLDVRALHNLGVLLNKAKEYNAAVLCLRRVVGITPENASAWSSLGNSLRRAHQFDAAVQAQEMAVKLAPEDAGVHFNMGILRGDMDDLPGMERHFKKAAQLGYSADKIEWERSLNLLKQGKLKEGFVAYESRFKRPDNPPKHPNVPVWDGKPMPEGTLMVHCEQGFGDVIQFLRFVPIVKDKVKQVVLLCREELLRLVQASPAFEGVRVVSDKKWPPRADAAIPLLSLPRVLGTTVKTIPGEVPYLAPPEEDVPQLKMKQKEGERIIRVGIFWQGKTNRENKPERSYPLENLLPLLRFPGVRLFSFQMGGPEKRIQELGLKGRITDLSPAIRDFADTAALMQKMDLVISSCSSPCHLAGALGVKLWTPLSRPIDWRWLAEDRTDSPWYPSMRQFRQTIPGVWDNVFPELLQAFQQEFLAKTPEGKKKK